LTAGFYRGGRRPIDIYWRLHSGINGTGMPPQGATLSEQEIWDLVHFLRALPYEPMRRQYKLNLP
jgi:mono/diheme cytochrome c family protein